MTDLSRVLLLTGLPGVGKTTVVQRAMDQLSDRGFKVGGILTREVRRDKTRIGFEIEDLSTRLKGWLAHVSQPDGPQIGKYRVNLRDLEGVGAKAILSAIVQADIIAIDEIGPMELTSTSFRESVTKAINSEKIVLATIHHGAGGSFTGAIKQKKDVEIIEVTLRNREELPQVVTEKIAQMMRNRR